MWTNEFSDFDTVTTVMDEDAKKEDICIFIDHTGVYIRQWDDNLKNYNLICASHQMWKEMQAAMNTPEGMYVLENEEEENVQESTN